jgi:hypothetical protein
MLLPFRGSGGDLRYQSRKQGFYMLTQKFVLEVKCYVGLYAPRHMKMESKKNAFVLEEELDNWYDKHHALLITNDAPM